MITVTMLVPLAILLLSNYILAYDGEPRHYFDLEEAEDYFSWFVETYNKTYTKQESKLRFKIFMENLKIVNEDNVGLSSPVFGITKFFDLTTEEFKQQYTVTIEQDRSDPNIKTKKDLRYVGYTPEEFDWTKKGVVTSVKEQAECVSGWAFAATGSVEATYALSTSFLVELSVQQLIDCDKKSKGCQSGRSVAAWQSIIDLGGQEKASDYKYTAKQGPCAFNKSLALAKITSFSRYNIYHDEEMIKSILFNEGPLAFAVDATGLQTYKRNILENCKFNEANHVLLLVGYGTEAGVPYWIAKNSWGSWGENGYVRLKRGVNACGLANSIFEHAYA